MAGLISTTCALGVCHCWLARVPCMVQAVRSAAQGVLGRLHMMAWPNRTKCHCPVQSQIGGCALNNCMLWHGRIDPLRIKYWMGQKELPLPMLALRFAATIPYVPRLLRALQPMGASPRAFQRLKLEGCLPQPRGIAACTQLRQLSELALENVQPADGNTLEGTLAALLQQASQLSSLDISINVCRPPGQGAALGAVPASLASHRGLTRLSLVGHGLVDLPAGDYLTGGGR